MVHQYGCRFFVIEHQYGRREVIEKRSLLTKSQHRSKGIFPDEWKSARVTLFKQGERRDIDNYRLISVISITDKAFERISYNQLFVYLSGHNILSEHQSGFRALHSTAY